MKRIFGMMPSDEIKIRKYYNDGFDHTITITAGDHGWTIIYADGGTAYKDVDATAEENFNAAYKVLSEQFSKLEEVTPTPAKQVCRASQK